MFFMNFGSHFNQQISFQMQSSGSKSETEQNLQTDRLRIYKQTSEFIQELLSQKSDIANPFQLIHHHFKSKNQEIQSLKKRLQKAHQEIRNLENQRQRRYETGHIGQKKQTKNVNQQIPVSQSSGSYSLSYSSSQEKKRYEQYKQRKEELKKQKEQISQMQQNFYLSTMSYISSLLQKDTNKIIVEKSEWEKMVKYYHQNDRKISKFQPVRENSQIIDFHSIKDSKNTSYQKLRAICQVMGFSNELNNFQAEITIRASSNAQKLQQIKKISASSKKNSFSFSTSSESSAIDDAMFVQKMKNLLQLTQPSAQQMAYFEKHYKNSLPDKLLLSISQDIFKENSTKLQKQNKQRLQRQYNQFKQFFIQFWNKFFQEFKLFIQRNIRGKLWQNAPIIPKEASQHILLGQFKQSQNILNMELQKIMNNVQRRILPYNCEKVYYLYSDRIRV